MKKLGTPHTQFTQLLITLLRSSLTSIALATKTLLITTILYLLIGILGKPINGLKMIVNRAGLIMLIIMVSLGGLRTVTHVILVVMVVMALGI